jgi:hypothetical protein
MRTENCSPNRSGSVSMLPRPMNAVSRQSDLVPHRHLPNPSPLLYSWQSIRRFIRRMLFMSLQQGIFKHPISGLTGDNWTCRTCCLTGIGYQVASVRMLPH